MPEDHIRYDLLTQAALRGVVRTVLADVAKKGLPGEHHFRIAFATAAPGVRLSERLRAQYPQTMTIILQHQFWDLAVREEVFDVGLSFGGVAEKLTVPFAAVSAFFDPAVQFGFQFDMGEAAPSEDAATKAPEKLPAAPPELLPVETNKAEALPTPRGSEQPPTEGGQVVSLDRFRKK